MAARVQPEVAQGPPLSAAESRGLGLFCARLPLRWTVTARRRRFFFLALASPGFAAVFSTPLHRSLPALLTGGLLFAAAVLFRHQTENVFVRAEAAALWPPAFNPVCKEKARHA